MFQCINDRYDPHGSTYDDVQDFEAMCFAAYGERVSLYERDGEYLDNNNETVLVPVPADNDTDDAA